MSSLRLTAAPSEIHFPDPDPLDGEMIRQLLIDHFRKIERLLEDRARLHPDLLSLEADEAGAPAPLIWLRVELDLQMIEMLAQLQDGHPLGRLSAAFGLSVFECAILLLCAGFELEATWAPLCAAAQGDPQRSYPTFGLCLSLFSGGEWHYLTPEAPLRRWRLVHLEDRGGAFLLDRLRIDERILHYLLGTPYLDPGLQGIIEPIPTRGELVDSHRDLVDQIAALWEHRQEPEPWPLIQLCGEDAAAKETIAVTVCQRLGLTLHALFAGMLPTQPEDLQRLMQLWQREAILSQSALLLDCDAVGSAEASKEGALLHLTEYLKTPLILISRHRRVGRQRPLITYEVGYPTSQEQRILWESSLGSTLPLLADHVDVLVSQFNLNAPLIRATSTRVLGQGSHPNPDPTPADPGDQLKRRLWQACRAQARPRLEDLAQRIESRSTWSDLVLPGAEMQVLREITAHVRQRSKVYEQWGFARRSARGLGISALFAGGSGTGKTLGAEVITQELSLDLYRIDLSTVISKYVGETEKNLGRVFDAAEMGGVVLLFDEADALFGKRSDVKDAQDRYANIEVGYLLQRMEAYRGLAILTTNLKDSIDTAFLRRIRFSVRFPFPDQAQRIEIWRRVFPPQTPTQGLVPEKLARLNVSGGNIRNIALNAAFLAADDGEPVQMRHLLAAARSEYLKLEKTLTEAEIKGWI